MTACAPASIELIQGESRSPLLALTSNCKPVDLTSATNLTMRFLRTDGIGQIVRRSNTLSLGAIDLVTGTIKVTDHGFASGEKTQLTTSGTLPAGLSLATDYYIAVIDKDTITLSASSGGSVIVPTGAGTGTHTLTLVTLSVSGNPVLGMVQLVLSQAAILAMRPGEKMTVYLSYVIGSTTRMVKFDRAFTVIDPDTGACGC